MPILVTPSGIIIFVKLVELKALDGIEFVQPNS